jgi:glutamine synthetase
MTITLEDLRTEVEAGRVDTVLLAITDMQGRLQGKRMVAQHFVDDIAEEGAEGCNYLLAVDVEMNTVEGYDLASWAGGYGDFQMVPDLDTLRLVPWQPGTAVCLADVRWGDGTDVAPSPRQVLRKQLDRLAERGWTCNAATELEFMVFRTGYEDAWRQAYRDLVPANLYNVDYSILGTARVEPLLRRIRNEMLAAGMPVEDSKGECNLGQHEVNIRYGHALTSADQHVIYKNGAKEIAAQEDMAITFMAKFDQREGSSCHIHCSLADAGTGKNVFAQDEALFHSFVAGQQAHLKELTMLFAPNVNSYKRYAAGSFAPTAIAWGNDNRSCALRVVGHGEGLRVENRVPGADVNPYLALAATIAAGLDGIDRQLELGPPMEGNAYEADVPQVPKSLFAARELFVGSELAKEAFGAEVVDHYANMARVELEAFGAAVTDWERFRGFERM